MKKIFSFLFGLFLFLSLKAQYSYPSISNCESINYVQFNSLINYNSACGNSTVTVYPDSVFTTSVSLGGQYIIQIGGQYNSGPSYEFKVWIDFNNDSIFSNNEKILSTNQQLFVSTKITIPNDTSYLGKRRLRILKANNINSATGNYNYGECEDYTITITSGNIKPDYCIPISWFMDYPINKIRLNDLRKCSNSSSGTYISFPENQYTTDLQLGRTYRMLISKGYYSGITVGWLAYIDFNDDHFFTTNEYIFASIDAVAFKDITIPNDTNYLGKRTLRVRSRSHAIPPNMHSAIDGGSTYDFIVNIVPYIADSSNKPPNAWEHIYSLYGNQGGVNIYETYDKGCLINGLSGYYMSQTEIIKTNNDGQILWKKEENGYFGYSTTDMDTTLDGGFVSCGITSETDASGASYVRKYGPCGNIEWTQWLGTQNEYDYAYSIEQLPDSGYIVGGRYWWPMQSQSANRYGLARLDKNGDTLWVRDITHYLGADLEQVIEGFNSNFIVTGSGFATNPNGGTQPHYRPFITNIDSSGNEIWSVNPGMAQDLIGGAISIEKTKANGYLCFGFSWPNDTSSFRLTLIKVNNQGQTKWVKLFDADSIYYFSPKRIRKINDNSYALLTERFDDCDYRFTDIGLFIIDSLGNVLHKTIIEDFYGNTGDITITKDKKIILTATQKKVKNNSDIYIARFNTDLSIDTFSNAILLYDSLCDSSVFIAIKPTLSDSTEMMIYPNPCISYTNIYLPDLGGSDYDIQVYATDGRLIDKISNCTEREYKLNTENYKAGLYLIRIRTNDQQNYSAKLLIAPR